MAAASSIRVRPVESPADWRAFFAVKDDLYRADPHHVRMLHFQRRSQLDDRGHPFYRHAVRQPFVAWSDHRPIGRIAAIIDRLHQERYAESLGTFGFFESPNDRHVAQALLDAAEEWLRQRGCDAMRGPLNPSMKSDFGVLVEGHNYPPYIMMAHTPGFYHELLVAAGFDVVRSFVAFALHASDDRQSYLDRWETYEQRCQKIRDRYPEIRIRTSTKADLENDIQRINTLGDHVRAAGWGFVPLTPEELDYVVGQLRRVLRPGYTILAERGDELVGYIMAMPDVCWALQRCKGPWDWLRMPQLLYWLPRSRRARIFGFGVTAQYRNSGIAGLLIKRLFDEAGEFNRAWELSWVDTENIRSIRSVQGFLPIEAYKKYNLYQRAISPAGD